MEEIVKLCKCGVFLTVNEHRADYQSAADAILELSGRECPPEISTEIREGMITKDSIVHLQFYPDTPIGSYSIYHYDVSAAVKEALDILKGKENE
jgi:hypothetical protein